MNTFCSKHSLRERLQTHRHFKRYFSVIKQRLFKLKTSKPEILEKDKALKTERERLFCNSTGNGFNCKYIIITYKKFDR